jgi:uncharacterized repeat protein (TIGR01451 family)
MNLRTLTSNLSKKTKIIFGSVAALAVLAVPAAVFAGYGPNGPDRVIFDFANPAQREGAFDAPRFNSYINTNVYGDERAFVDAKECVTNGPACYQDGVAGGYADQQPVTPGKEYIVRAYIHNIANPSINDNPATPGANDGIGVAKNTKVRFELPDTDGVANGFTAQARITADNAIPQQVYDTVDLRNNNEKFGVEYIPGSAYIFNASHTNGLNLSDDIMSANGTLIGDDVMDGTYPGCFEYSSFVVIRVKVTAPELEIEKLASKVEMPKMTDTSESVTVKRGENVSWRINYKNNGTHFADEVTVRDEVPAGLEIVPGSIVLTTAAGNETLPDTALGSGGVNVGDYAPQGNGVIRFTTKVNTAPEVCELTNIAFVRGSDIPEQSDTAKVVIEDCKPDVKNPVYVCDSLDALLLSGNTYKFTTKTTALNGATVKRYIYNFGDNTEKLVTDKSVVEHTYAKTGTFASSVEVVFLVNGQEKTVSSKDCAENITIGVPPTTPPTTIPNTGAGSTLAAVLAVVAAAGTVLHRRFTLNR